MSEAKFFDTNERKYYKFISDVLVDYNASDAERSKCVIARFAHYYY